MDKEVDGELTVALATVTFFQGAVQHADDKIRTVVAVLGALIAFMSAQLGLFTRAGELYLGGAVVMPVFTLAVLAAGTHLFRAFRPYTGEPVSPNRFAFPSVARQGDQFAASAFEQRNEARRLLEMLARLAMAKNGHVRRAIGWTGVAYVCAVLSLVAFPMLG